MTGIGERPHRIRLQNPGPPMADGDGSYTQTWADLSPPQLFVAIVPASSRELSLERIASGTVLSTVTHVIDGPNHPQVTTQTRILFRDRVFNVTAVTGPDQLLYGDMTLLVSEIVV